MILTVMKITHTINNVIWILKVRYIERLQIANHIGLGKGRAQNICSNDGNEKTIKSYSKAEALISQLSYAAMYEFDLYGNVERSYINELLDFLQVYNNTTAGWF